MLIVSHPTGNQFVRALVHAAHRREMLGAYCTTVGWGRRGLGLPAGEIRTRPLRESVRLMAQRFGINSLTRHERGWASIDAVYRDLDESVARDLAGATSVYAYEDGALVTFRAAGDAGIRRYYDLPIVYWETSRRLLSEEAERYPEWEPTLGATRDSEEKVARKTEELRLADLVICPSRFVQKSLPAGTPSLVAEFGSPPQRLAAREHQRPLRVLFAGAMTQRKGLADLFEAMRILGNARAQLVVVGAAVMPLQFYRQFHSGFEYHPPGPHSEILDVMRTCDVLVLPSIVEGRALVQQEAMSCGLPLIVTPNAGAEDLVREETGFLVPIRSPDRIAECINWFVEHRSALPEMRHAAQQEAARHTWDIYAERILNAVDGRNQIH